MKSLIITLLLSMLAVGHANEAPKPWVYTMNGEFAGTYMQFHEEEGTGPHSYIHLYPFGDNMGGAYWACVVTIPDLAGQPNATIISRLTPNDDKSSISSLGEQKFDFVIFPDGRKGIIYSGMTFAESKAEVTIEE